MSDFLLEWVLPVVASLALVGGIVARNCTIAEVRRFIRGEDHDD
jgi:hypothetical protein